MLSSDSSCYVYASLKSRESKTNTSHYHEQGCFSSNVLHIIFMNHPFKRLSSLF